MKLFAKQILIAAALLISVPALAGEGPTKGTKSYQSARSEKPAQQPQANNETPATAEEAAQMAPAAGGDTPDTQEQGKTMREEMKLPRKH